MGQKSAQKRALNPPLLYYRLQRLAVLLHGYKNVIIPDFKVMEFPREVQAYQAYFADKTGHEEWEGVMLKKDTNYTHKRTMDWLKHKPTLTFTLAISGFKEGKGRHAGTLGALQCADQKRGIRVCVGTGFDDDTRASIWQNQQNLLGKAVEIEAASISQNAQGETSLRHPVFLRLCRARGGST